MARQAIKSYAIDPAHTNDSHAIDRARKNRLRIVIPTAHTNDLIACRAIASDVRWVVFI